MNDTARALPSFTAPGPGTWELDSSHFPRPVTRHIQEIVPGAFLQGMKEGFGRYGMMLSHMKPAFIHGLWYHQYVAVGAPEGATGTPPRLLFQALTRLHPAIRQRVRTSRAVFEQKLWREDAKLWREQVKPASIQAHLAIQAVDVAALTPEGLADHLLLCRDHHARMFLQHFQYSLFSLVPVGDLLAHLQEWAGLSVGDGLNALKGASPISRGVAAGELERLGAALRHDREGRALLERSGPPAETLELLCQSPGAVGEAARAYLETISYRSLGYDICDKYALELPHILLGSIRREVEGSTRSSSEPGSRELVRSLRDKIPPQHRETFDAMLAEARLVYGLRDERGFYSDGWACGLTRRAVLAAGSRLVSMGRLEEVEIACEATMAELAGLLRGQQGPGSDELRARARQRATVTAADAPRYLGAPPSPPPPIDWLPTAARRGARALEAALSNVYVERDGEATATAIRGLPVSPGVYEGVARLVTDLEDFGRVQPGDVLVTRTTSPYFNVVLPLLGAIVTDRGGQLSHAAIVAREYGIPGVVGTVEATRLIPDGTRVRVDGARGEVRLLA